jgi:hypothetical protein
MSIARRAALPAALALACVLVYWHALLSWFFLDDFAWLGLPLGIHSAQDVLVALFMPRAQGTVRVLSERLPFLIFGSLFGIHTWPFRVLTFGTQFANLALVASIGRRLTGSALAGAAAALFWLLCEPLASPMAWGAGYNEILWAFLLLLSFHCLLRFAESGQTKYWTAQWVAYLLGFGALELNVVYPALALLYVALFARKLVPKVLWLFLPALVFTAIHYLIVPEMTETTYRMYFDRDMFGTFLQLLSWALGPVRMGERGYPRWTQFGIGVTVAIGAALLIFAVRRLLARDRLVLFLIGWFVIIIAPLVPLKNHVTDYYPAVPGIGLAWLGGYAFASAFGHAPSRSRLGVKLRPYVETFAVLLALFYVGSNYAEIRAETRWRRVHSRRLQAVLRRAEAIHRSKPGTTVLLDGVDWELFSAGLSDSPFRLFGMPRVYIMPATMDALRRDPTPLRNLELYRISEQDAQVLLAAGDGLGLSIGNDGSVYDTTERYRAIYKNRPLSRVNAGNPLEASDLGGEWYGIENGFRWMGRSATVRLAGPQAKGEQLTIHGSAPKPVLSAGPLHLSVSADGSSLGRFSIENPDQFTASFPLPDACVGKTAITVALSLDRTLAQPGDLRKLGLIFGEFEIK